MDDDYNNAATVDADDNGDNNPDNDMMSKTKIVAKLTNYCVVFPRLITNT